MKDNKELLNQIQIIKKCMLISLVTLQQFEKYTSVYKIYFNNWNKVWPFLGYSNRKKNAVKCSTVTLTKAQAHKSNNPQHSPKTNLDCHLWAKR